MLEMQKDVIRRIVREVFEQGNVEVVDELLAEDFVDHSLQHARFFSTASDREGFKQMALMARNGLSGLKAELDLVVAEGDLVAARVLATGVHDGPLMGVPPTGKPVDLADFHYFRFKNGKVSEHWNQFNALEVMQQLGVVPQP
ncbi:ester cyclase [Nonomuraea roseoviolacea subsp. roseoviolacea]|uniref:ester cyclase n=1 Tax=Nonomuraea roseoviolacea TaxID=103837 RepID=UPI0031E36C18